MKASSAEIEHLRHVFLSMDVNRDGRLSFDEIKAGIDKINGASFRYSKSEYMEMMYAVDKDQDGYVDYQEFITAATNKAALVQRENLMSAFSTFDRDGSGMITIDELKQVFDTMGTKKDASLWLDIMKEVDSNGDNQISFEEFTVVMQKSVVQAQLNESKGAAAAKK
jgi:calcium-dependent protein kinase